MVAPRKRPRRTGKIEVKWALRFVHKDLEDKTKRNRDYKPLRDEAVRLFAPDLSRHLTTGDLREAKKHIVACLEDLKKGEPWGFDAGPMRLSVSLPRGRAEGGGVQIDQAPQGRWQRIVLGVLYAMRDVGPQLKLCREKGCPKIFLVSHVAKELCPGHVKALQKKHVEDWQRTHDYAQRKRDLAHAAYRKRHPGAKRRPRIAPTSRAGSAAR